MTSYPNPSPPESALVCLPHIHNHPKSYTLCYNNNIQIPVSENLGSHAHNPMYTEQSVSKPTNLSLQVNLEPRPSHQMPALSRSISRNPGCGSQSQQRILVLGLIDLRPPLTPNSYLDMPSICWPPELLRPSLTWICGRWA